MKKTIEQFHFLQVAVRDYKVGAWSPSSRYLIERVLKNVEKDLKVVVEFGPGEGAMTRAVLDHLAPDGILIAIEPNATFVTALSKIPDKRLRVIQGTAGQVMKEWKQHRIPEADLILSSIPFSFLKPKEREALVVLAYTHLKKGGSCIVFHQYYPMAKKVLEKVFKHAVTTYEWRNFLPCFVFSAKKLGVGTV